MNRRENKLKAIRFEGPEFIPMGFHVNPSCWHHYDQNALQDLMEAHHFLFPDFARKQEVRPSYGLNARKDQPYTDPWGCVWHTSDDGIAGSVHDHPLADWSALDRYRAPDPAVTDGRNPVDWAAIRTRAQKARANHFTLEG